jgi:uncharacterized protein involved in response to NO
MHGGLALILMIECVPAGRVIPAFTMSALPGLKLRSSPRLARGALCATALALAAWVLLPPNGFTAAAFGLYLVVFMPWLTRTRLDGRGG